MGIRCMMQGTHTGALCQPRGEGEEGDGREVKEGGDTCYLWLIHTDVQQKTTKFCKAITLQLKKQKNSAALSQYIIYASQHVQQNGMMRGKRRKG